MGKKDIKIQEFSQINIVLSTEGKLYLYKITGRCPDETETP